MAERDDLMKRTRAARAFCNSVGTDEGTEMNAFLALFHPEMPEEKRLELAREAREKARGRR